MRTVRMLPPMYRQINAAFNVRGKPVIFCWGDTIYNPTGMTIPPELRVHEAVHSEQQGDDPAEWWKRYIGDAAFRLDQELPAHRAEWRCLGEARLRPNDAGILGDLRERALHRIAERLSSPLYGSMIDYDEARRQIAA